MSSKLGWITTTLIAGSTVGAVWVMPAIAHATEEDEPTWSCVDDGNRICGPNNSEGKQPGCYDDGGVLEFSWPCEAWTPADGWMHGDGSVTFPDGHTTPPSADGRADSEDTVCDFDKTCVSTVKHRGPSTGTGMPRGWPKRAT